MPLTWETASDWDGATSEAGVVHDSFGDLPGDDTVQLGYPVTPGQLAYWPLDENSGSTATDVAGTHAGTYHSVNLAAESFLSTDAPGFDGENSYINVEEDSSSELNRSSISIAVWTRLPSVPSSNRYLIRRYDQWHIAYDDGEQELRAEVTAGDSSYIVKGPDIAGGAWHHVVLTIGDTIRLYVDGAEHGQSSYSGTLNSSTLDLGIGAEASGRQRFWPGTIETVQIYDHALSASAVDTLASAAGQGTLTTDTRSFATTTQPGLSGLAYNLNGESITLDVIGSPGTSDEEVVTQTLDGSNSYSLSWGRSHTDFQVRCQFETADITTTPTLSSISLVDPGPDVDLGSALRFENGALRTSNGVILTGPDS